MWERCEIVHKTIRVSTGWTAVLLPFLPSASTQTNNESLLISWIKGESNLLVVFVSRMRLMFQGSSHIVLKLCCTTYDTSRHCLSHWFLLKYLFRFVRQSSWKMHWKLFSHIHIWKSFYWLPHMAIDGKSLSALFGW